MKKIINKISIIATVAILFSSCEDSEDFTGASNLSFNDVNVTLSTSQASYTFNESMIDSDDETTNTILITGSLDSPQPIDVKVSFSKTSGEATSEDYSLETLLIPAGKTSASAKVTINKTGDIEGTETLTITAKGDGNINLSSFSLPVTIDNDYINDVLELSTTWAGSYEDADSLITVDFCSIDFDVLLFTAAGSFVGYVGATSSCTETSSLSGLDDGEYFLVLNLYNNILSGLNFTEDIPVTITYSQEHFIPETSFTVMPYNLSSVGSDSEFSAVATITVEDGYNYTITPL